MLRRLLPLFGLLVVALPVQAEPRKREAFEVAIDNALHYLAGAQNFSRLYVAAVQGLTQHAAGEAKALRSIKTVQDALAIQASIGRGSFERAIAEGTKLQEAALDVVKQVYTPLTQRATLALQQTAPSLAA